MEKRIKFLEHTVVELVILPNQRHLTHRVTTREYNHEQREAANFTFRAWHFISEAKQLKLCRARR